MHRTITRGAPSRLAWLAFGLSLLAAIGCGSNDAPNMAEVEGTITLDGKPVRRASVVFTPIGGSIGGPSYGVTDDKGHFVLNYSQSVSGAVVGSHRVTISTKGWVDLTPAGDEVRSKEIVPAQYNVSSDLSAEVAPGHGPYDFALTSSK